MIDDSKLDRLIEEVIKEEIENGPEPLLSQEEAWAQIQQRLNEINKSKKNTNKFFKNALYTASIILFIVISLVWTPRQGFAFSRLTEIFHKIEGSFTQIWIKIGEPERKDVNAPVSDEFSIVEGSEVKSIKTSLEEAKQMTDFTIILPSEVPNEFQLDHVTVLKQESEAKSEEIYLHYLGNQRSFTIYEMLVREQLGLGLMADSEDTAAEKVMILDREARLLNDKNGFIKLSWVDQNHYYSIEGRLTKEEIMKIAESM